MEQRREIGEMSGVAKIFLSVGLLRTAQFERAAVEGSPYFQPDALYNLGRKDEAFAMAYEQASAGDPETLFSLLVRDGRDQDLVNFLEERWPSVAAMGIEHPGDILGYSLMADTSLAYSRTGNQERAEEALMLVDRWMKRMVEQGVNNFVFSGSMAAHHAMLGDTDEAFRYLQQAVDNGWNPAGKLSEVQPALVVLEVDPRLDAIETQMLATLNRDRAVVGLPPFNADYEVTN
jgi:hypothetical protein